MLCLLPSESYGSDDGYEEGFKLVNGVEHYYKIVGQGETYLLVHGGPGMYHDELVPYFLEFAKTHRVIFYDQRGNGKSELTMVNAETFSTEVLVDDIEGLRKAFGIKKLNLIGHSWGGLLSMYYAAKYPDHVNRLIAVSAAPVTLELLVASYQKHMSRFSEEEWNYIEQLWNSEAYKNGDPDVHNEALRLSEGGTFYDKSYVDDYIRVAAFDSVTARNAVELEDFGRAIKLGISDEDQLKSIIAPTLLINGTEDFIVKEAPILAQELIKNSKLVWVEKSGHYPYIEQPIIFFKELESFIKESEGFYR